MDAARCQLSNPSDGTFISLPAKREKKKIIDRYTSKDIGISDQSSSFSSFNPGKQSPKHTHKHTGAGRYMANVGVVSMGREQSQQLPKRSRKFEVTGRCKSQSEI